MKIQSFIATVSFVAACCFTSLAYSVERSHSAIPEQHKELFESAEEGSATAQFQLGQLFEYGRGVNQNDQVAISWYEKAAAQQNPNALYRLAVLTDYGWGMESDKKQAFKLYKAAAYLDHELAQHDLAKMYFHGAGTPKNLLQAYKWLKVAVLNGSPLMQKHLNLVALEMSPSEIELADILADEWIRRPDSI